MSVLTPRQRVILRGYSRGKLADILTDPDHGIRQAMQGRYGRSGFCMDGEEFWLLTTARGIELNQLNDGDDQVCDVLPWPAVARLARALPAGLVAEVRECRQELYRVAAARPEVPVRANEDEQHQWEREIYRPWLARKRGAEARLDAALDKTLAGADSQAALFELPTAPGVPPTPRNVQSVRKPSQPGQDRLL